MLIFWGVSFGGLDFEILTNQIWVLKSTTSPMWMRQAIGRGGFSIPPPFWVEFSHVKLLTDAPIPIGSMYGIFIYIWLRLMVIKCRQIYHTWILWDRSMVKGSHQPIHIQFEMLMQNARWQSESSKHCSPEQHAVGFFTHPYFDSKFHQIQKSSKSCSTNLYLWGSTKLTGTIQISSENVENKNSATLQTNICTAHPTYQNGDWSYRSRAYGMRGDNNDPCFAYGSVK